MMQFIFKYQYILYIPGEGKPQDHKRALGLKSNQSRQQVKTPQKRLAEWLKWESICLASVRP
jgi:hypothetical protein